jgi:hypothetical protein
MKRPLILAAVSMAAVLVFMVSRNTPEQTDPPALPQTRQPRAVRDFWHSAHVPEPEHHIPTKPIRPEDLGIIPPTSPVDHPARITRAISENDLPTIQSAVLSWFERDPAAARDWLATQPTYADLEPAISYIAHKVSEQGDLGTGIKWSALLPEGTLRDDTLFNIHALALRNGRITPSEINLDMIPSHRQAELLSGAAGD